MAEKFRAADVYGISRDIPLNYVARESADGVLIGSLTRDKHLVVYGSSKQGKTCLRKYNLKEDEYVVVTCSNRWSLSELHSAILKRAGYVIEQSTSVSVSGHRKINARFGGKVGIGNVAEVSAQLGAEKGGGDETTTTYVDMELDPADVNDVISALERVGFDAYIVLEDFHYLSAQTQEDFAVALKAFHEDSRYCFVVVGVWLDENRIIQLNGDLTGRVTAVGVDAWSEAELRAVIREGENRLNVRFDETFKDDLIRGCFDSVATVQEACFVACEESGVSSTLAELRLIGASLDARQIVKSIVDDQSGRYNNFINTFAAGFQDTRLNMYRWILYPVLTADTKSLERGLSYGEVRRSIESRHPEGSDLNPGNVTQALRACTSLQVEKGIKPIILDYNQSQKRLELVDRGFPIWLEYQSRADLLAAAGLPQD